MKRMTVIVAAITISGCVPTASVKVQRGERTPTNECMARFMTFPCCQTTYRLVDEQGANAVPVILKVLDRYPGETNALMRCQIIQGALWCPENCTNIHFQTIIQRGTNDPSALVISKTTNMVERAMKRLREAEDGGANSRPAGARGSP